MAYLYKAAGSSVNYSHSLDQQPDPQEFHMHAHDVFEIYFFIAGNGTYAVESTVYPLRPGCILLMRPGEVHRLNIRQDTAYERAVLQFREQAIPDAGLRQRLLEPFLQRPLGTDNCLCAEEYDSPFFRSCLSYVERHPQRQSPDQLFSTLLPALLAELCESYARRQAAKPAQTDGAAPAASRMRDILAYVNEHLLDELTLEELSEHFYLSKSQIGRLFLSATGSAPWEYILVKRLIEARRQMLAGVPITRAAANCGFRDYSAFYRAYKKRYGVSPAAERIKCYDNSEKMWKN